MTTPLHGGLGDVLLRSSLSGVVDVTVVHQRRTKAFHGQILIFVVTVVRYRTKRRQSSLVKDLKILYKVITDLWNGWSILTRLRELSESRGG